MDASSPTYSEHANKCGALREVDADSARFGSSSSAKRQDLERALCRLDLNHPPTAVGGVDRWSLTGAQIRKSCTFILKQRIHVEVAALFTANAD